MASVREMHYDFKKKFNKVDSNQNRNLLIPEIDWALNEAQDIIIDLIAQPRPKSFLGFEKSQKNIDDIRVLVVNDQHSSPSVLDGTPGCYLVSLPTDYRYFARLYSTISKKKCSGVRTRVTMREHDDNFEESYFDSSSFEWRVVNGLFTQEGIKLYTDNTFSITDAYLSYIRKPRRIHNAQDYRNGTYKLPSGESLTGSSNCELPEQLHREIVDLAVMIITGEVNPGDYQIKYAKVNLNNLK